MLCLEQTLQTITEAMVKNAAPTKVTCILLFPFHHVPVSPLYFLKATVLLWKLRALGLDSLSSNPAPANC